MKDVAAWLGMIVLLALSIAASRADWGAFSTAICYLISAAQVVFVAFHYMRLRHGKGMTKIFALAGVAWLCILFSLVMSDYVSRGWLPYPSRWPVILKLRPGLNESNGPDQPPPAPRPGGFGIGR